MRQEVDIRYVVTSLKGSARHLYETVYCQRGQMENLIKLHKAQLASDHMSCHSATANQVRLVLHTAAFWSCMACAPRSRGEQSARQVRVRIGGGAVCPAEPPTWQINPERVAQRVSSHRSRRTERRRATVRLTRKKNARVVHDPG